MHARGALVDGAGEGRGEGEGTEMRNARARARALTYPSLKHAFCCARYFFLCCAFLFNSLLPAPLLAADLTLRCASVIYP